MHCNEPSDEILIEQEHLETTLVRECLRDENAKCMLLPSRALQNPAVQA